MAAAVYSLSVSSGVSGGGGGPAGTRTLLFPADFPGRPDRPQRQTRGGPHSRWCSEIFQHLPVSVMGFKKKGFVPAEWRLFCVRGELPEEGSLLEVDCCCGSLRSRGSVVLLSGLQGVLFLWTGCKAASGCREVGRRVVERLTRSRPSELGLSRSSSVKVQVVEEGSEPAEFWSALGPVDRKAYDCMLHGSQTLFCMRDLLPPDFTTRPYPLQIRGSTTSRRAFST